MTADARRIISEFHEKAGVGYDPENTDESFVARVQRLMATELAALRCASRRQETEGAKEALIAKVPHIWNTEDELIVSTLDDTCGDPEECSALGGQCMFAARGKGGS